MRIYCVSFLGDTITKSLYNKQFSVSVEWQVCKANTFRVFRNKLSGPN